jgi:putative transposase
MSTSRDPLYRGHRFPPEVISYAVWLYFRFPLSLRMVEEMLAARGIRVTYEIVRQWGTKFGKAFSDRIRQRAPAGGDKWHMDEVVVSIAGEQQPALARRRSEWLRSRRLGPASKRQSRCAAAHEQVPEIRRRIAARHDHRQAPFIRRGGRRWAFASTWPAQGPKQSRGELSPADKATQTDHEAIQISPAGTTVSVGSRSSREPLPHLLSRIRHC